MKFAIVDTIRTEAAPGLRGTCPSCGSEVRSKCGSIVTWHWSHLAADCDPWTEPETAWHRDWKNRFPVAWQEQVIGCHRADIHTPAGWTIELQHSAISPDEIQEREWFYTLNGGKMAWVVDASDFATRLSLRPKVDYMSFRWKQPRRSWEYAHQPLYFDFGNAKPRLGEGVFRTRRIHDGTPCGGYGNWLTYHEFAKEVGLKVKS
jgi:competence protein CoiA